MIPMLAVVKVAPGHGARPFRLWLPLFLVWILLAPLAILALPFLFVAAVMFRVNPFTAIFAVGGVLSALAGVNVEVQAPDASVLVKIQ